MRYQCINHRDYVFYTIVEDQNLVLQIIKKLMLAWDPDYTKLKSSERKVLEEAERDFENGNVVNESDEIWK